MTVNEQRLSAYKKLGVTAQQVAALPQITYFIRRRLRMTLSTALGYLRASSLPEAREILRLYDTTDFTRAERPKVTLEALCAAASISPPAVLELIGGAATRLNLTHAAHVAASASGRVMAKTVEMALTDDGVKDRTLVHRITGMLPTPKGASIIVNNSPSASATAVAQSAAVAAPPPEQTIRRLADRFNEKRGAAPSLPEGGSTTIPAPAPIDAEYADVDGAGFDGEGSE